MWEAADWLSILSTGLVGKRPWGQVPEQAPCHPFPSEVRKRLFLEHSISVSHGVNSVPLDGVVLDSSLLLSV